MHFAYLGRELPEYVLDRHLVRARIPFPGGKIAELARKDAHVRRFDLLIEDEIDCVPAPFLLHGPRHCAEPDEVACGVRLQPVFERQPLPALDLFPDRQEVSVTYVHA